jgi:hypothetical protein
MPKRWNRRYLILFCLLIGALALTACGPISLWKAPGPQHSSHVTAALALPCTWHAYPRPPTAT